MPAHLFMEWCAYYQIEPFGEQRDDLRAGVVAAAIYNVNRGSKTAKVLSPADFVLKFGGEVHRGAKPQTQSWAQVKAMAVAMYGQPQTSQRKRRRRVPEPSP